MFSIQTNINSIEAQENIRVNGEFQSQTIRRLTSGYRINQSGDDAAGLAIANKFRSDSAELVQGVRNANDAVSVLQIIDGGLNNIGKIVDRLKTLATQGASDTFKGDYATLNTEYNALLTEIDRQANNIALGTTTATYAKNLSVHIGGNSSDVSVNLSGSAVGMTGLGLATAAMSDKASSATLLTAINSAVSKLGTVQGSVGTAQNELAYAIQLGQLQISSYAAAESRVRDADMAAEAANLTKAQVLQQAGFAAMAQSNSAPQQVLTLLR